ncbi:hypothetical protein J5N97_028125 [Dioscorea zingiberensis]|uniref:Tetratricopeptide repeat protein n=1 Tax=Dioscorea zingiberensis TaxID=325984 RepID=A0A9D5H4J7_9LILI|nr:hypothetical protein J5N97_028125 [Dioscorea zingiberensis]
MPCERTILRRAKDDHFAAATDCYNRAARIDPYKPSTWIENGQLCVARGELNKASDNFKIVLDTDPNSVPALVAKGNNAFVGSQ